jgi:hypothetical protein
MPVVFLEMNQNPVCAKVVDEWKRKEPERPLRLFRPPSGIAPAVQLRAINTFSVEFGCPLAMRSSFSRSFSSLEGGMTMPLLPPLQISDRKYWPASRWNTSLEASFGEDVAKTTDIALSLVWLF